MGARTLLIGLDALGRDVLDHLMAGGVAPALEGLRKKCSAAEIENYAGMGEGVFWPSVATGLGPGGHGRYFYLQFDSRDYEVKFRDDADHFDVESFWKRLDREGRKVGILDWPRTPVEDLERGFLLDNWLGHDPVGPLRSRPALIASDAARKHGMDPWGGGASTSTLETAADIERFIREGVRRIAMKAAFAAECMHRENWDLFAPVFSEPHDFGHYLWHVFDRRHPRHDLQIARAVGDPMLRMGAALDEACAKLIDAAGKDAAILVLAGPGMAGMTTATPAMEEITRQLDLGKDKSPTSTENARSAYRRYVPYWIRGRASKLVRRILRPALHSELASRRFFAVPHNAHAGCVRINVKGREPHGVVEPGAEYESLIANLIRDLMQIRDADTGAPAVKEVARTRGVHAGAHEEDLPDLFVIWRRDAYFSRISSPKIGVIDIAPHQRTGDHLWDGFLWSTAARFEAPERPLRPHQVTDFILSAILQSPSKVKSTADLTASG
jgi:predicted AlkP superfamily phosphohydrolase/phosphomutase